MKSKYVEGMVPRSDKYMASESYPLITLDSKTIRNDVLKASFGRFEVWDLQRAHGKFFASP